MKKLFVLLFVVGTLFTTQAQDKILATNYKPQNIQSFEWKMFPKPLEIKKKGNRVIVVFDRKEWERFSFIQHRRRIIGAKPDPKSNHHKW